LAAVAALLASAAWAFLAAAAAGSLVRARARRDARALGSAFLLVALTAAPLHGLAGLTLWHDGGPLPLAQAISQLLALVPLAIFTGLRVEALTGGRAERIIRGLPAWFAAVPALAAFIGGAAAWEAIGHVHASGAVPADRWMVGAAMLAMGGVVGILVVRAQEAGRRERGGWSLSGLAFASVFPAMGYAAAMDAVLQPRAGVALLAQAAALPACALLLLVARRLHARGLRRSQQRPLVGPAARAARRSPWEAPAAP
jgi:hypothetical protein